MKIKTTTALTAAFLAGMLLALVFDLFQILDIQRETVRSEENRLASYKLADELRQSSDDLTRMARSYVLTGETRYRDNYFAILDIRNGLRPRPHDYSNVFWWRQNPDLGGDQAAPLRTLMAEAGFSERELALLGDAQNRSDKLVGMEREAFAAMGDRADAGGATRRADPVYARSLLFGAQYDTEKARIMQPIEEFLHAVDRRTADAQHGFEQRQRAYLYLALAIAALACCGMLASWIYQNRAIHRPITELLAHLAALTDGSAEKCDALNAVAVGSLEHDVSSTVVPAVEAEAIARNELGALLRAIVRMAEVQSILDAAFRSMMASLRSKRAEEQARDWLKTGRNELNDLMRGEQDMDEVAPRVLSYLAERLRASVGALYLYQAETEELLLAASYAVVEEADARRRFRLGEGVAGQVAVERKAKLLHQLPDGYLRIGSALGNAAPRCLIALPLLYGEQLFGVLELASFRPFTAVETEFLEHVRESVAVGLGMSRSRQRLRLLLLQTEEQAEELRVQQEELQVTNEELTERAEMLEQDRLRTQTGH